MGLHIYIVILCSCGLWNVGPVFGETADTLSILNDIRNELNSLKLSNKLNERKMVNLERQVKACRTENAELIEQKNTISSIEERLADIDHKAEANNEKLLKRLEAIEMSKTTEEKENNVDNGAADEDIEVEENFVAGENGNELELTDTVERKTRNVKRIIPVTSLPQRGKQIAFSCYLSQRAKTLGNIDTIPFDFTQTNEGQGFDTRTHVFTCPVSGAYYFSSALLTENHEFITSEIVKNGEQLALMYAESDSSINERGYDQGFNSVVTICNKGEMVWVRVLPNHGSTVFGGKYSTFTGYLLWDL